jgi:hypothetical protein
MAFGTPFSSYVLMIKTPSGIMADFFPVNSIFCILPFCFADTLQNLPKSIPPCAAFGIFILPVF